MNPLRRSAGSRLAPFVLSGLLALAASTLPASIHAQELSGLVAEQGTLAPAVDAVVTLFLIEGDNGSFTPAGTAVTDEEGAFHFEVPAPGRYRIQADLGGLSSPLSPAYAIEVGAHLDDVVLLVPSRLLMLAATCDSDAHPGAVVVGVVRDAGSEVPVPDARVRARWIEGVGFQDLVTGTDEAGHYLLCGVPTGEELRLRGEFLGRDGEWSELEIARTSLVIHDLPFTLASRTLTGGDVIANVTIGSYAVTLGDLRGQLLDQLSGAPIAQAVVRLRGTGFQTVTDAEGRFAFPDLQAGEYTIEIQHLGYSVQTSALEVPEGRDVAVTLHLSPRAVELAGLEVTARTVLEQTIRTSPFQQYVLAGEVLREAEVRGSTAPEVLRANVPGLRVRETYTDMGQTFLCIETNRRTHQLEKTESTPYELRNAPPCAMVALILDGNRVYEGVAPEIIRTLDAANIESLEFVTPLQAGTRYGMGGNVANGVLVIYTRGRGPFVSTERNR